VPNRVTIVLSTECRRVCGFGLATWPKHLRDLANVLPYPLKTRIFRRTLCHDSTKVSEYFKVAILLIML
jgi:hypothetical protein